MYSTERASTVYAVTVHKRVLYKICSDRHSVYEGKDQRDNWVTFGSCLSIVLENLKVKRCLEIQDQTGLNLFHVVTVALWSILLDMHSVYYVTN